MAYVHRHNAFLAVLFLDLDHFKRINDTLGHHLGDLLLQYVADRLSNVLRSSDVIARHVEDTCTFSVSRFGGDEFVLLLTALEQVEDAAKTAERILDTLSDSFALEAHEVSITTSIGISIFPSDGEDPETLIKNADAAMYHAKNSGRNNFQFYADSVNASTPERLTFEKDLGKALEREELILSYQPRRDTSSLKVIGTQAQLHWQHPKFGPVSEADFMPLAEESGMIVPISKWLLHQACMQQVE
jgi:diguanylate cyclase (GGDEF)-like protein